MSVFGTRTISAEWWDVRYWHLADIVAGARHVCS